MWRKCPLEKTFSAIQKIIENGDALKKKKSEDIF